MSPTRPPSRCPVCKVLHPGTGRCPRCRLRLAQGRAKTAARGYGSGHQQLRADYQRRMNRGEEFYCWRCEDPIDPEHWHLGHDDADRGAYRGPECVPCNTATAGRR